MSSLSQVIFLSSTGIVYLNANISYDSIFLSTSPDQETTYELIVYVNGEKAICDPNCNFTFTNLSTPEIISISPQTFEDLSTTFTISGIRFSENSSNIHVTIGTETCEVTYANDTEIVCVLARLNLGQQKINVYVKGIFKMHVFNNIHFFKTKQFLFSDEGNAVNLNSKVNGLPFIKAISPATGSYNGGTNLTIIGNGFTENSTIMIDTAVCNVEQVSIDQIICITTSHPVGVFYFAIK